jgi:hypothetical protein
MILRKLPACLDSFGIGTNSGEHGTSCFLMRGGSLQSGWRNLQGAQRRGDTINPCQTHDFSSLKGLPKTTRSSSFRANHRAIIESTSLQTLQDATQ